MGLREEATEPWGLLLGATAGGLAWASGVPGPLAAAVGAVVWGIKVVTAAAERRPGLRRGAVPSAVVPRSPEAAWLARGQQAAAGFADLARSLAPGPLAERVGGMQAPVRETLTTLERLAEQASAAGGAIARLDDRNLAAQAARLDDERRRAAGEAAAYFDRALAAVEEQRQVVRRLSDARAQVLVRMQSSVVELEGLVARMVELSALATGGPAGDVSQLEQVADELEGVRRGLAEAEELSRRALRAYPEQRET